MGGATNETRAVCRRAPSWDEIQREIDIVRCRDSPQEELQRYVEDRLGEGDAWAHVVAGAMGASPVVLVAAARPDFFYGRQHGRTSYQSVKP